MRAIVQDAYGSADVLRLAEIDEPDIAANEVLVGVRAAGVDRGTWHLLAGQPYLMRTMGLGFRRPKNPVPGRDVAGTVPRLSERSLLGRFAYWQKEVLKLLPLTQWCIARLLSLTLMALTRSS